MNKIIRSAAALLLVGAMTAGMLVSCDGNVKDPVNTDSMTVDDSKSGDVSVNTGETITFLKDGSSDCKLIRPDRADSKGPIVSAANTLRAAVKDSTGVQLDYTTDWVAPDDDATNRKEILIGNTSREETATVAATLRENDYAIQVVNNKLVILGGTDDMTVKAVDKFIELYFSAERSDLVLNTGYRYQYRNTYSVQNLIIGDSPVSDYTVVYGKDYEAEADYFCNAVALYTGCKLKMVSSDEAETAKEILIGVSGRSTSVTAPEGSGIAAMDGDKLVLNGSKDMTAAAVRTFLSNYVIKTAEESKVEKDLKLDVKVSTDTSMKLIDLNIALSGYAETAVVNRYPRLYQFVQSQKPDVLCLQEVSCTTWYDCITNGIDKTPALTDEYGIVTGTGRNGTMEDYNEFLTGAYAAVLYNKAKYDAGESGTFWLSETPSVASVGWDGRSQAICTWVKLTDKTTGKSFVVMNTQIDPYGKKSPENGAALIAEKAASFGVPVFVTGDFASTATEGAVKQLGSALLVDSQTVAAEVGESGKTVNNYGGAVSEKIATDYILVPKGISSVSKYTILKDKVDNQYISSHWAVCAEINF